MIWAHPRSRGADVPLTVSRMPFLGSSPLARGGLRRACGTRRSGGLIPARAGRTGGGNCRHGLDGAHPRSRGADPSGQELVDLVLGSSPLARGGPKNVPQPPRGAGLIPARAGRTLRGSPGCSPTGAHPRSRGADVFPSGELHGHLGSSPLARGGPSPSVGNNLRVGLIPARAGRTVAASGYVREHGAHPRSRGADRLAELVMGERAGSSPLARGGPLCSPRPTRWTGLIPARAGRTGSPFGAVVAPGAHPRSRGADHSRRSQPDLDGGSSPLARGGPVHGTVSQELLGLIPARAGRTRLRLSGHHSGGAHPRSRGADLIPASGGVTHTGSSPFARGGRLCLRPQQTGRGLIPARAGRTRGLGY